MRILTAALTSAALAAATSVAGAATPAPAAAQKPSRSCGDAGLKLPAGFCASVFADDVGHARHLVVAPSGVVYVNTWSGRYYGGEAAHPGGFLVALQSTGDGRANAIKRFGATAESGGHGGTGIALYKGALYVEESDRIERYALTKGQILSGAQPAIRVTGHPAMHRARDARRHLAVRRQQDRSEVLPRRALCNRDP
jgi:glucose/arabinose dehydrogenase